jgi:putative membrane protein insertion efficiency factor
MTAAQLSPTNAVSTGVDAHSGRKPLSAALILLVRLYQAARHGRPSSCRYLPTCSVYAIEAVERHGAWRGSGLAARRLGRCHPWGGHGADPVPE